MCLLMKIGCLELKLSADVVCLSPPKKEYCKLAHLKRKGSIEDPKRKTIFRYRVGLSSCEKENIGWQCCSFAIPNLPDDQTESTLNLSELLVFFHSRQKTSVVWDTKNVYA